MGYSTSQWNEADGYQTPTMGTNPVCLTGTLDADGKFSLAVANEDQVHHLKPWSAQNRDSLFSAVQTSFVGSNWFLYRQFIMVSAVKWP